MKLIHTGDLHIGITINGFNMLEDQEHILGQIINIALEEQADAVLLAGDLYDRSVPSADAVKLLDFFISDLIEKGIKVFAVSGNHDSPERLSFGNSIMKGRGFFIEGIYEDRIMKEVLKDEYGDLNFYLLPYFRWFEAESMDAAVREAIEKEKIDASARNVMITHNFVTTGGRFNELVVGDVENVDASVFDVFDYTALGHIHSSMKIGAGNVFYSGSPLKYSFSNVEKNKSVNIIELLEKGKVNIISRELYPLRDMRKIRGELKDLIKDQVVSQGNSKDYICATILNKEELIDPIGVLRQVYPNVMQVIIDKNRAEGDDYALTDLDIKNKTEIELFTEFFKFVTGEDMDLKRSDFINSVIEKAKRGESL